MTSSLVEVHQLSKAFKEVIALDCLSFSIKEGSIVAIAGPDGAGKTTLIRLIAGLLLPSKGTISVLNLDTVKDASKVHKIIGYMPQRFGLYEDLTVMQNLELYSALKGVKKETEAKDFERLLQFTTLGPFRERLARDLSGGMKQKLGLACTLLSEPKLLILDEPTVGVDPISRRELWSMVEKLLQKGVTVIWSTSYLDEAEKCDSALLMHEGKILFSGKPSALSSEVAHRTFLVNNLKGNKREILKTYLNKSDVIDGTIQGKEIRLVLRKNAIPEKNFTPTPPRFEDGFIDILGGGPGGKSGLAETNNPIPYDEKPLIEAVSLMKKFGSFTAVDNISFSVKRGEVFGLLGPNGAGKSTLFKMLCGLLTPTSGYSQVAGIDLQKAGSIARGKIGYMAQKFSLYGNMNLLENLEFFSGAYNLQGKEQKKEIEKMIEVFNFKPYLLQLANDLPLGFKQRLALACATMHHPEVLFLDEPTSGVDPITRREFWNHINGLVEKGVTVMVTTHFMDEAEYCDRIALVYQSKLITLAPPDHLKEMAITETNKTPTLEEAFIHLIEAHETKK